MSLWSFLEVVDAVRGQAHGKAWQANNISIDSRYVTAGDLFIALKGERVDGHDYVSEALQKGAVAAVVEKIPANLPATSSVVVVPNSEQALRDLATTARARSNATTIAVTGSVGKTSTCHALRFLLSQQAPTHGSAGSQNNHLGVPLNLARLPREARYGIFELGMNHPGEIAPLSRLVRPQVAVITTIAAVHIEYFSDGESGIAREKASIMAGVPSDGSVILNADNPHFPLLFEEGKRYGLRQIYSFGTAPHLYAYVKDSQLSAAGSSIDASIAGQKLRYRIPGSGRHHVLNSVMILATIAAAGGNVAQAAEDFAMLPLPDGRGRVHRLPWGDGQLTLIDDSYNASPVSMRAMIESLALHTPSGNGRRIVVLADMLELGDATASAHAALAQVILENKIDLVFCVGANMAHLAKALPPDRLAFHSPTFETITDALLPALRSGDVVAVKGSRGGRLHPTSRMYRLAVEPILNASHPTLATGTT